jgi:putative colanic acid biosynthesis UDP-glucose lipid carrier transferase
MSGNPNFASTHAEHFHGGWRIRRAAQPPRHPARHRRDLLLRLPGLLRISDWVGIALTGFGVEASFGGAAGTSPNHGLGIVLGATVAANYLHLARAYSIRAIGRVVAQSAKVSAAWVGAFLSVVALTWAAGQPEEFLDARGALWLVAAWAYLLATRYAAYLRISAWQREGRLARDIAVLGSGPAAAALAERLSSKREVNVVGVFVEGGQPTAPVAGDGDGDLLASLAKAGKVDGVVLALPWTSSLPLNRAIGRFSAFQVDVMVDPGVSGIDYAESGSIAGIPTLTVQRRPLSGWGAPIKRVEDVLIASLLLALLTPMLLAIALMVKMNSPGPVLFRQERYGFNGNRIAVFKFRSMYHDPNPDPTVPQARRNDPRVTRVGAFLRRTSLDELPQLINVLRGEMSLVGPRPHAAAHDEKYAKAIDGYLGRHRMKPGITGWAQVNGCRGSTETTEQMRRRLQYDIAYIASWSLLLDIKILLMTGPAVILGTNAY